MDFLIPSGLLPSNSLYMEYAKSEITKMLNTLQTREFYNENFDSKYQMSEEAYDRLKKRYESRPPFVFFFNPTIQLEEFTVFRRFFVGYYVGYVLKRDDGEWVSIYYKA